MTGPTPTWPELLQLMTVGPPNEPTVRGAIRHRGRDEGWVVYGGIAGPPPIAGIRAGIDPAYPPPLRVWRHGNRVRLEEPDGRVNLIVSDDRLWQFNGDRGVLIESPRRDVQYMCSGTQLLERRPLVEYAGNDFTQPAGNVEPTTFLGRPAWAVELAPPPHKPHPMQLVVDAETGIVLQQRNDGFGTVDEWVEFVTGEDFNSDVFTWSGPSMSAEELHAIQDAEHEADMAQRREWFSNHVTSSPLRIEFEIAPLVHVHASDGSFEASLGDRAFYGSLARRSHSTAPWELRWQRVDHRWSTKNWDWALTFHDAQPTGPSLSALIDALSGNDK